MDDATDIHLIQLQCRPISAEATHPLRLEILRPERPVSEIVFPGDDDAATLHVGTFRGEALVAVASLYYEARSAGDPGGAVPGEDHATCSAWRLRGMATATDARRIGAGAAALEACERHAREQGGTLAWCNARTGAVAFYEVAGWHVLGEEFDIPTVGPHFVMEKSLR